MKETLWLFYFGIALIVAGFVGAYWISNPSIAAMILGTLLAATSIVMHTFQQKQHAIQELANEVRVALSEQNSKFAGLKDHISTLHGDILRIDADLDKLDLDQLKKFESRLQFVENVANVRSVMMMGNSLKKEA